MKRIAYLVSEYPAPSHTFIRREIEALQRHGLTIVAISVRASGHGEWGPVHSILGAPHQIIFQALRAVLAGPWRSVRMWLLAQQHRPAGLRGFIWAQFHFVEALVLVTILRGTWADRLHSHFANSGATVAMLAADFLDIPWSLTLHGISETDPPAGSLLADKIKRADFVACASWFMRAQAMRLVPAEAWVKLHLVRCGLDLSSLPEVGMRVGTSPVRVITVGRLSAEKGYPGLLDAFRVMTENGIDAHLTIVGNGPLEEWVLSEVDRLALGDRVTLCGALPEDETLAAIASSDIFVLASLMEGLPVVLMEAIAMSKPVVAPCVAGIPELVKDRRNGLLFRPGDWSHLASCMGELAANASLREELATHSLFEIEREFDVRHAVVPLITLFKTGNR